MKYFSKNMVKRNKKRFSPKDKKLRDFLVKGGREGSKKDFFTLLKRAVTSKA